MCLYPKLIRNPKYKGNKKNGGIPPILKDDRVALVPVGCGFCIECRKQKARDWKVRLIEESKSAPYQYFVTLTYSNESLVELSKKCESNDVNIIATESMRLFLERWRKKYKRSMRHWFVTELGDDNTERLHMHGIIYAEKPIDVEDVKEIWKYGHVYIGDYCTLKTINYIVKYITKIDQSHPDYVPKVLCSAGIGRNYIKRVEPFNLHDFRGEKTQDFYRLPNGTKIALPIYYRNKCFTDEEREKLWLQLLDKNERYVLGVKISNVDTLEGAQRYWRVLERAQETNRKVGYQDDTWKKKEYKVTLDMLKRAKKKDI